MSRISRRDFLAIAAVMLAGTGSPGLMALADEAGWIEVLGSAVASGESDRDAARRRALADALLAAALAGGAMVKGHSVLSNTRLTSDLLVVRPTGSVLAHRIIAEEFDGRIWRIRIRARVGRETASTCGERRRMFVTIYPPKVRVAPSAPAWAAALAGDLALPLAELAEAHPAVAGLTRASRQPNGDPARDGTDYLALTTGNMRAPAGGHGLFSSITVEPAGRRLRLSLHLRLDGPAGERLERTHEAEVRLPGPSLLGGASVLIEPERRKLAARLAEGVRPSLASLLDQAGCRPVLARLERSGQILVVHVGRAHGVTRTSIAFTVDSEASTEMLEVVRLSDRQAVVVPLDPVRPVQDLAGRPVRFFDTGERAW